MALALTSSNECRRRSATIVALAVCAFSGAANADSGDLVIVTPLVDRLIRGGQTVRLEADVNPGELLVVDVNQEYADVLVTLTNPATGEAAFANAPVSRSGRVVTAVEAQASTTIDIRIRSLEAADHEGPISGLIGLLPPGGSSMRREAILAMAEAGRLNHVAETSTEAGVIESSRRSAAVFYKRAAEGWRQLDEPAYRGVSLYFAGKLVYDLYDWTQAVELFEESVDALNGTSERLLVADAKQQLAAALIEVGSAESLDRGSSLLKSALTDYRRAGDRYRIGQTENAVGMVNYYRDDWPAAKRWFSRAATSFASVGEDTLAVRAYTNSAKSDEKLGRLVAAAETHARALTLANRGGDALDRASVLDNYADTEALLGRVQEALALYQEAADEFARLGDPVGRAKAVAGIGFVMYRLGEWASARNYATQALALQQGGFERRPLFETLRYLGNAHRGLGDVDAALGVHRQAEDIAVAGLEQAQIRLELGEDYLVAGRHAEAAEQFAEAGVVAAALGTHYLTAYANDGLGRSVLATDPAKGLGLLNTALEQHAGSENLAGEAQTHQALAVAYQTLGDQRLALDHARQALAAIERLRARVDNPRLVASFNGLSRPTYDLQIELLMQLAETATTEAADFVQASLEVSERGRARALLDYLAAGWLGAGPNEGGAAESRYRQLSQTLAELRYRREQAETDEGPEDSVRLAALQAEIDQAITELTIIEGELRDRGHGLVDDDHALSADHLRALVDTGGDDRPVMVLEFSLGPNASFLWEITGQAIAVYRLPAEEVLNQLARSVHDEMSVLSVDGRRDPRQGDSRTKLAELLLGPVADRLADHRLMIVPDGALYFVPFAALPVTNRRGERVALVDVTDVGFLPSLTTLHRQRHAERVPAGRMAAVFANPVFSEVDPRWPAERRISTGPSSLSGSGDEEPGPGGPTPRDLAPLPWTAAEADVLARIAPPDAGLMIATGFDATVATVLDAPLNDFRILHFATHGWADSTYPELSSLSFSRYDRGGRALRAELQLPDIYRLKLNSDLVVLSACDTALGKYVPGEGVLGLTHAFMSAGSRRVVATLWQVSDRATARMMELFYQGLLDEGMSAGRALAEAQRQIKRERRWADPYFWAGFTMQGDWR